MKTFSCPIREAECDEYMWIFEYSNIFVTNIYSDIHFYHFDRNMFGHLFVSNQVISNMNVCWLVIFLLCAVQRNTSICSFLAPTGAHIVMMVYHIYIYPRPLFQIFTQFIDAIDVTIVTLCCLSSINAIDVTRCWLNVKSSTVPMFQSSNVPLFQCVFSFHGVARVSCPLVY